MSVLSLYRVLLWTFIISLARAPQPPAVQRPQPITPLNLIWGHPAKDTPGTCTTAEAINLHTMLTDMQRVSAQATGATKVTTNPRHPWVNGPIPRLVVTWLLPFFGIYTPQEARAHGVLLNQEKVGRVRKFLDTLNKFIVTPNRQPHTRPILLCGASAIRWMKPDDYVPLVMRPEEIPYQRIEDRFGCLTDTYWIFYIPGNVLDNVVKGAFFGVLKESTANEPGEIPEQPYPNDPVTGRASLCGIRAGLYSIVPAHSSAIGEYLPRPVYIFCPNFWTQRNSRGTLPLAVDTSLQPDDSPLDRVTPMWLVVYAKLLHDQYADPLLDISPDHEEAQVPMAPITWERMHRKRYWKVGWGVAWKPWQCSLLAIHDDANPLSTDLDEYIAIHNIYNYAWYIIAVYLGMINRDQKWKLGYPFELPSGPSPLKSRDLQTRSTDHRDNTWRNSSAALDRDYWDMHALDADDLGTSGPTDSSESS